MKKVIMLLIFLMSMSILSNELYNPDKVDEKIIKQIEGEMDSRQPLSLKSRQFKMNYSGRFKVIRILKTPDETNMYHGKITDTGGLGEGGIFEATIDDEGKLLKLEKLTHFEGYEESVHKYFEKLAKKHLGEYVRARGGGVIRKDYVTYSWSYYRSFDELVKEANAGIAMGDTIIGGAKIYVFNEMNSQEEIDKLRENLFNLIKEMQEINMRYESFYIWVVKPIALLNQTEIAYFTKGAGLSNCVEKTEVKENSCDYVMSKMQSINKTMDEAADGKEKNENAVNFLRTRVNRLSYDSLLQFDNSSYKELGLALGFNKIYNMKKVEDIVFGDNRGKEYHGNYYKIGRDDELEKRRRKEAEEKYRERKAKEREKILEKKEKN